MEKVLGKYICFCPMFKISSHYRLALSCKGLHRIWKLSPKAKASGVEAKQFSKCAVIVDFPDKTTGFCLVVAVPAYMVKSLQGRLFNSHLMNSQKSEIKHFLLLAIRFEHGTLDANVANFRVSSASSNSAP